MSNVNNLLDTISSSLKLISVAISPIEFLSTIKDSIDYISNISNALLIDKIKRFLDHQDDDFDEKLKLSTQFQTDALNYKNKAKLLVNTINSFHNYKNIDIYANLTRAWLNNNIDENLFHRLSFILSNLFYEDINYLHNNIDKEIEITAENYIIEVNNLYQNNLLRIKNKFTWGASGGNEIFVSTDLGRDLVSFGLEYDKMNINENSII
ncbi:MAG: hypothetical protein FWG88_10440 [Oscillospiraceae bacterium]|nr:hypothetical protein [Oscillospiraceae bacterium]